MVLTILVNGRQLSAAPYRPERVAETAQALTETLPVLRQLGRVAVVVRDGNVSHLIVTG